MERVRIGKDIVFQWEVRKDGAALTAEDAANLTLEIAGRNGKSQRLPFEIRDSKIIAAWYGVRQTEIGAYRLTCWHNRGKVGESVVDVVWAVELVRYTTEETFDELDLVTIELEAGDLTFGVLKGDKGDTGVGIESIVETQTSEESGGVNIITVTLENGEQSEFEVRNGHGFTQAQSDKLDELPTNEELQSDLNTIPNEVVRGAEDAQFVHAKPNEQPIGLFYLRKVDNRSAGLMTAADKQKMDALPTGAFIPVMGRMTQSGFDFTNSAGTTLFSVPFADSTGGGLITFADLSRFMELGTKQELDAQFATKANKAVVDAIQALIPSQATASNQLADKDFVNSSVATSTATFRGSFNLVVDFSLSVGATHAQIAAALGTHVSTADNNDYAFVSIPTSSATPTEIAAVERYKFNGSAWVFEYALNNSGFTAAQWAAINSGITALLVAKLQALPTASDIAAALNGKADKSDTVRNIGFDEETNSLQVDKNGSLTEVSLDGIKAQGDNVAAEYRSPFSSTYTQDVQSGFERITSDVTKLNEDKEDKANKVTEIGDNSTDTQYPSAKGVWTAIKNAIAAIKQWATSLFARTDGWYSRMIVGGAESLIGDVPQTATYTFRRTGGGAIGEPVARLTEVQGNTGVVNQLNDLRNSIIATTADVSKNVGNEGASKTYYPTHKYLISGIFKTLTNTDDILFWGGQREVLNAVDYVRKSYIKSPTSETTRTNLITVRCNREQTTAGDCGYEDLNIFDLTIEYGAGYEPGTVAEFKQRIWRDYGKTLDEYIAYTPGKLINCKAIALENVGQNQWDEEWELGTWGAYADSISKVASSTQICNKNLIPVLPSTTYCITNISGNTSGYFVVGINDADTMSGLVLLSRSVGQTQVFTTGTNTRYIGFSMAASYGTSYKNDICINISDAALNGTYRPYWKEVTNLNLTTLTGINPTTGVRETIFPNGMGGGDGWRDVVKVVNGAVVAEVNTARVNLGDLTGWAMLSSGRFRVLNIPFNPASGNITPSIISDTYTQVGVSYSTAPDLSYITRNDGAFFIINLSHSTVPSAQDNWLDGVYLEYQLATPIIYTDLQYADGTPFELPKNFEVQNGGTEKITHAEGEDSIAPVMSAIYGLNAVGFVQDAPKDYTSQATLDALLSALSSVTGHTFTKTWDSANNKWVFS